MNRMEKKRENAEEKRGKPPKEKKTPSRETPKCGSAGHAGWLMP